METITKQVPVWEKGDTLWMTSYDPHGFCGCEYHPKREDIGIVGEVVRVYAYEPPVPDEDEMSYVCYTILTYEREPRFLEVMDTEVTRLEGVTVPDSGRMVTNWHACVAPGSVIIADEVTAWR